MNEKLESENSAAVTNVPSSHSVPLDEVEKMIATAKDEVLKEAQVEINKQVQEVKKLKEAQVEIDKQIQIDRASSITVLGIFASVLSFLSIEFSFFKNFDNLKSISGFSCILFSLLLGFNVGLDYLVKSNLRNDNSNCICYYVILLGIVFFVGIFLVLWA